MGANAGVAQGRDSEGAKRGLFIQLPKVHEFNVHTVRVEVAQVKYKVVFFQCACILTLVMEETEGIKVIIGMGRGATMVGN